MWESLSLRLTQQKWWWERFEIGISSKIRWVGLHLSILHIAGVLFLFYLFFLRGGTLGSHKRKKNRKPFKILIWIDWKKEKFIDFFWTNIEIFEEIPLLMSYTWWFWIFFTRSFPLISNRRLWTSSGAMLTVFSISIRSQFDTIFGNHLRIFSHQILIVVSKRSSFSFIFNDDTQNFCLVELSLIPL